MNRFEIAEKKSQDLILHVISRKMTKTEAEVGILRPNRSVMSKGFN